ncbi:MAG: SpoIIE family protein phosphatase [Bacteroidota bacterium]|nr:SpoIIE family protein phosphatase [Bacteroidota bacterium]
MFIKRNVKKCLSLLFLFSVVLSNQCFSTSVTINGVNVLAGDEVKDAVKLDPYWRFSIGDNTDWANPDFDYSKWDSVYMPLTIEEFFEYKFKGNLWLRNKFVITETNLKRNYSFLIKQYGASEIYIDGKLVHQLGKVSNSLAGEEFYNPQNFPISFSVGSSGTHTIAIRFSNHVFLSDAMDESYLEAFNFQIVTEESAVLVNKLKIFKASIMYAVGFGLFLALGVLNFVLFLFYKRDKTNLLYSIFCVALSVTFIFQVIRSNTAVAGTEVMMDRLIMLFSFTSNFFLLSLVFSFVYEKMPKRLWVVLGLSLIGICLIIPESDIANTIENFVSIYSAIDIVVVILVTYFKRYDPTKKKRRWVLIILTSLVLIACLGLFIHKAISLIAFLILVFIVVLPVAGFIFVVPVYMAVRHARSFAVTNKSLEEQLEQVKELSAKTIEQEQEKKRMLETQNEMLEEQVQERTSELAEKNLEITDSINYARRIQRAILTSKEEINESLKQCFVLFKPKDIVSGDFYFYAKKENTVMIAAADCTGHGVPGALMSMIGCEKLIGAVSESTEPSVILNTLNRGIKSSLRQSDKEESTRDGMDIAFTSINLETNFVQYAGANRPIWIIRNGTKEVEEIKATKKAIGGFTSDDQHFDQHTIQFNTGDTFYLFSDGYADQFGSNGKKLMTKKFREILLEIQNLPMDLQEKHLDDFIESWKKEVEQVDDILVIGVRV